ncbi:MAG: hypothetical protein HY525_03225 [Betaproteobacteria bacterium]|nr:hypothetical protein [Betaproteobacteria bacterium]
MAARIGRWSTRGQPRSGELVDALNGQIIVAAIGPVAAAALRAQGITPT